MEQKFYRQCQSCGMPLKNGEASGSEADGSKSLKYCNLCYEKGHFINPDCTLEEMKQICDNALKEKGWHRVMRWFAKKQLPSLERWAAK